MNSISNILTGIATAVHKETGRPVYLEFKENGAEFPCFYISLVNSSEDLHVSSLYDRTNDFDILYFLNEEDLPEDVRGELHDVGERLYSALEYITVDGQLMRSKKRSYKVTDGVMHFLLTMEDLRRKAGKRQEAMRQVGITEGVKNGNNGQ